MKQNGERQRVLAVMGSPRKNGNSSALARAVLQGAGDAGMESEIVYLHELSVGPCRACYACQGKKSTGCALDDDMQNLYPALLAHDAWILASPVYWFTMSAQMKLFMDRLFGLPAYGPTPFRDKKIVLAMAYGDRDPFVSGCVNALRTFQDAFRFTGSRIAGMVYGSALDPGDIEKNREVMKEAEELGRILPR